VPSLYLRFAKSKRSRAQQTGTADPALQPAQ